ncbi:MAG: acyl-CoA thioesterase [Candidatus Nanopelagicales bacterium]
MTTRECEMTLRFLAAPGDLGYSGNVDGGRVMEWVDKAGFALAVGWSRRYCVTAYVGNVQSSGPVRLGHLVEVTARLVHTGRSSMHIEVAVRSSDPRRGSRTDNVRCLVIFVAIDEAGQTVEVPAFVALDEVDRLAQASAIRRIDLRAAIEASMATQTYSDAGTAPRCVLRFLASPKDVNWGGKVHGGIVMRWIDEAAHVVATRWADTDRNVAVYSGGTRFYRPLLIGDLVEVEARLIHTSASTMHMSVHVRAGNPRGSLLELTTHCLILFVALDDNGHAIPVQQWDPQTDEDVALDRHAADLVRLRQNVD